MIQIVSKNGVICLTVGYQKHEETFVFSWSPHRKWKLREVIAALAAGHETCFDWQDAAEVYDLMEQAENVFSESGND